MPTIKLQADLTGIRAKVDGSLGLSFSTPELSNEEKVKIMAMQNVPSTMTLESLESTDTDVTTVKAEINDGKTPSQRLRASLFVLWNHRRQLATDAPWKDDFEAYYRLYMEKTIHLIHERIAQYET